MVQQKYGTILLDPIIQVKGFSAVVGQKEGEGPLQDFFDLAETDMTFGQPTWEKAESKMQELTMETTLQKCHLLAADIGMLFGGDLLNQCIGSAFAARSMGIPFYGLYGACSTMAESLSLASLMVSSGMIRYGMAVTSSHFCASERQFRMPLEYGGQRTPTAQWTVTGAGSLVLCQGEKPPFVKAICTGTVTDLGISDMTNMGAAMAPAAYQTLKGFFEDTHTLPQDYDLIVTGDLGLVGGELLCQLLEKDHLFIRERHKDCGTMIFDCEGQDMHAGGSGCGCSASVLCGHLLNRIQSHAFHEVLFVATGALMSVTSFQQGESIPAIAHLVHLSDNNLPHTPAPRKQRGKDSQRAVQKEDTSCNFSGLL